MNGPIFIPTLGRATAQITLTSIPERLRDSVRLVAPPAEVAGLQRLHRVQVLSCDAKGIAATRQWIVDNCDAPVCTMIDDDQVFFKRIGNTVKLTSMSKEEVGLMLEEMDALALLYPMVGLSARQGNNHHDEPWFATASRVHNHYALDLLTLKREGIRFSDAKLMEDFYVNLRLLTLGYTTIKVIDRCWNQSQSNAPGGCSGYRNAALQEEASMFLAMEFPEVVEAVRKTTKGGWFGGDGERWDVKVQWKKALQLGITRHGKK